MQENPQVQITEEAPDGTKTTFGADAPRSWRADRRDEPVLIYCDKLFQAGARDIHMSAAPKAEKNEQLKKLMVQCHQEAMAWGEAHEIFLTEGEALGLRRQDLIDYVYTCEARNRVFAATPAPAATVEEHTSAPEPTFAPPGCDFNSACALAIWLRGQPKSALHELDDDERALLAGIVDTEGL